MKMRLQASFACFAACLILQGCSTNGDQADVFWLNEQGDVERSDTPLTLPEDSGLEYRPDSRDREYAARHHVRQQQRDQLHSGFSPSVTHKRLNDYAEQLAMALVENAHGLTRQDLVGVASFVRFNRSLEETTIVGNQLAEYLMGELQGYGVSVVDFKLADAMTVSPVGDLALTRDGEKLARSLAMDHVLTGTMIEDPRGVRINARIVAVDNQQLMASASVYIPAFMVQSVIPEMTTGR